MLTTAGRDLLLAELVATYPYVGLLKSVTAWRAGTVVEADYTGYGTRPGVTWGGVADTSPTAGRQVANSGAVTFPTNTGSSQAHYAFGLYAASSGGSPGAIGFIDADSPILGTADTADLITAPAHGLSADQRVFAMACPGTVIPTGIIEDNAYFVLAAGLTADAFKISLTSGGAAVNVTASGAALFIPYTAVTTATNETPQYGIATLVLQL